MSLCSAQCKFICSQTLRSFVRHQHGQDRSHGEHGNDTRASAKLFADAVAEEATSAESRTRGSNGKLPDNVYPNWTGEESIQDAVLRMLVDKYKPLKGESIRTAEEKLKSTPPSLGPLAQGSPDSSLSSPEATAPITSCTTSAETHKPWLTTFRAPSHAASIRHMRFLPSPLPSGDAGTQEPRTHPDDARSRIEQRERKKKAAYAGRLTNARESSLDYRLGRTATDFKDTLVHRPNPASVKGWMSLVEERIERARNEGYFLTVKGRGKPLVRVNEESNPFISREEFLMNRIVQRQGAAPPWIEIQGELEAAVASFRATLRSSWTRRAVRSLTLEHPPVFLARLTLGDVTGATIRDHEWEAREAGYHEEALREVNALVRKYNGAAPYSVRRTFLTRRAELDWIYNVSGADILAEVKRRAEETPSGPVGTAALDGERDAGFAQGRENEALEPPRFSLKDMWHRLVV